MGKGCKDSGDRLRRFLEKLTSNRFSGVIVGMIVTAIIQSSSATSVMCDKFCKRRNNEARTGDRSYNGRQHRYHRNSTNGSL